MKKRTLFLNLQGLLGEYVSPISTDSSSGSIKIIKLQNTLNDIIYSYINKEATADNCKALWTKLYTTLKKSKLSPLEKTWNKYKEIILAVEGIGYEIAFLNERSGLVTSQFEFYHSIKDFFECHNDNEEEVVSKFIFFRMIQLDYNRQRENNQFNEEIIKSINDKDIYNIALEYKQTHFHRYVEYIGSIKINERDKYKLI